jgi:hypothetical protein
MTDLAIGPHRERQFVAVVNETKRGLQQMVAIRRRPTTCRNKLSFAGAGKTADAAFIAATPSVDVRRTLRRS